MQVNKAIILAAGRGERLKPRTDSTHKSLTVINGKPILLRLLDQLSDSGINRVVIVVGYLADSITDAVGGVYRNIKITYCTNEDYYRTNNIVSLQVAGTHLDEPVLLFECDLVIDGAIIKELLKDNIEDAMVVDNFKEGMEGTVVSVDSKLKVSNMILKKEQTAKMDMFKYYKTVNIYRFSAITASILAVRLNEYIKTFGVNDYYEIVIRDLIREKKAVFSAVLTGRRKWIEIDNEQDLDAATTLFKK